MSQNIHRHAYAQYHRKPYIVREGVPIERTDYFEPQSNEDNRTIIRTNINDNKIIRRVPVNGMGRIRDRL